MAPGPTVRQDTQHRSSTARPHLSAPIQHAVTALVLRVATLAHRCPHNHAFAQQQPATYRTNTVPPTERDACKQHKRERSTGLQGSGNEEGEQNGREIKSSGGGAEQNYSGREEAIACRCAAASIPAGGAHRQLCAPLIARAPRNLCSSSLSRAFWVRSAGLGAARESPMAWAMKARVQSRSKGIGSETQRCAGGQSPSAVRGGWAYMMAS